MSVIKLLSTDFDGTLIGASPAPFPSLLPINEKCHEVLALALSELIEEGVFWVINTGRPLDLLLIGLEIFEPPVKPHYLITHERHIYHHHNNGDIEALGDWNQRCDKEHELLFKKSGFFFERIHQLVSEYGKEVIFLESASGIPEELFVADEALLDELSARILGLSGRPEAFSFQRSRHHLHFCHGAYNKGSSLSELHRFLSIQPKQTLAIGDYHNDIAMLTGEVASMVACPSNAHDAVKKTVKKAGGHVSLYPTSRGAAEAIKIFSKK